MSVYVQDPWTSAQWDRERRTGMMYNNELQDEREREREGPHSYRLGQWTACSDESKVCHCLKVEFFL